MKLKFCPKCGETDLVLVAGGNIGMMECKKCGYRSSIFPEREESELKEKNKNAN